MGRLPLTLACSTYDRVAALADGRVPVEGVDLNFVALEVEETFFRMLRYREFDAAELSLSSYCVTLARGGDFVAIPVFPSRFFRHSCIFVSTASGIAAPADLVGKRIGVPEYQMTAPVWIRGILQDEYGVDPASVTYLTGGEEEPGREEKLRLDLPERFRVEAIGPRDTLSRMLEEGRIDALYAARTPSSFHRAPDKVCRLFADPGRVERDYFRKTGIFPIMHVVALRRDVYERNRWLARALLTGFQKAQQLAYAELRVSAALKTMLPWQIDAVAEAMNLMGADWWPYGIDRNQVTLETFLRYHHDQGLSPALLHPVSLFAPETLDVFKV